MNTNTVAKNEKSIKQKIFASGGIIFVFLMGFAILNIRMHQEVLDNLRIRDEVQQRFRKVEAYRRKENEVHRLIADVVVTGHVPSFLYEQLREMAAEHGESEAIVRHATNLIELIQKREKSIETINGQFENIREKVNVLYYELDDRISTILAVAQMDRFLGVESPEKRDLTPYVLKSLNQLTRLALDCLMSRKFTEEDKGIVERNRRFLFNQLHIIDSNGSIKALFNELYDQFTLLEQIAPESDQIIAESDEKIAAAKEEFHGALQNIEHDIARIAVEAGVDNANTRLERASRYTMFVALLFLVIAPLGIVLVALYGLNKHIIVPIHNLVATMKDVEQGKFDVEASSCSNDEIGELANAFNAMAKEIKDKVVAMKSLNKTLQESEEKYRVLYNNVKAGLCRTRVFDGEVIACNKKFAEMFGYEDVEACVNEMKAVERYVDQTVRQKMLEKLNEKGEYDFESELYRKDGSRFWASISVKLYRDKDFIEAILLDVTEQKIIEEERNVLEEQLRHGEKMRAIGQLAGGIAHDFNNQLSVLLGYAELLERDLADRDDERQKVGKMRLSIEQSKDLIAQLLAFSRKGKKFNEPVDLNRVVADVILMLERSIDKKVTFETQIDNVVQLTRGDSSQIYNAILNVGINACDAMPRGGTVIFDIKRIAFDTLSIGSQGLEVPPGEYVCVAITDDGAGMSPDTQERIFEPFFTTKEEGKGIGMGLAAAYGTMQMHKGAIKVYSEPGKGTTMKLLFPLVSTDDNMPQEVSVKESFLGEGHILLVDDNALVSEVGRELLSSLGFEVTAYNSPLEALAFFTKAHDTINIVIIDMIMPEMNGRELYRKLKEVQPDVKVILSSGYTINGEAQGILDEGVRGFVQKPFTLNDLSTAIKRLSL